MAFGFDLVVIGSGPGSHTAACRAAGRGMKTALVTSSHGAQLLDKGGVQIIRGSGRLDGPGCVLVTGDSEFPELSAPRIILAPQSVPACPSRVQPDGQRLLFPHDLRPQEDPPSSLTVVGAGSAGCAWSSLLSRQGCTITLVELQEQVLPDEDAECVKVVTGHLESQGVRLRTGHRLAGAEAHAAGVTIQLKDRLQGSLERQEDRALLITVGHQPAHRELGLDSVTVVQDRQGHILTDLMMQTATPGLYAIGDAVPSPRLEHLAHREAMVAVDHAAGEQPEPLRYHLAPRCHSIGPVQLGAVGFREDQALAAGHLVTVGRATFQNLAGESAGIHQGSLAKVVVDAETDRILGVHLVGPQAGELLPEAATVVGLGTTVPAWARVLFPLSPGHQVLLEAVEAARRGGG
jgi:dihydrolipoamide dehydrogenase|nr:NAD(P)/FAD-dependent oxidoreductase [Candidatus Krumholzibacteria bacterium]